MAVISQDFLVTRDIALRSGTLQNKYRTEDGRFILDNRALSRVRFTPDEYISGLRGIEKITHEEAITLIARGGYKMGDSEESTNEMQEMQEAQEIQETQENSKEEQA